MRSISSLVLGAACFLSLGCVPKILETAKPKSNDPNTTPANPPMESAPGHSPSPSVPKPMFSCVGIGAFSKIEIWSTRFTPVTNFNKADIGPCTNLGSANEIELIYPAEGSSLIVDGEAVTVWLTARVTDSFGMETEFFQYSDFSAKLKGCSKGQFISDDLKIIDLRFNEPAKKSGSC